MNFFLCVILIFSAFLEKAFTQLQNDDGSWKPIYEIVQNDEENDLLELLKHGVDVNTVDESGSSALHFATNVGNENMVNLLIQNNANVNIANKFGNTALHIAAINNFEIIAYLLVQHEANVNAQNQHDETPLHNAAARGYQKVVNVLLENQANVDAVNSYGDSALHFAANGGHEKILNQLIAKRANINLTNKSGNTALHFAALGDREKSVQFLLEHNARSNIENNNGKTPKDLAREKGLTRIVNLLKNESLAQRACKIYSEYPTEKIIGGNDTDIKEFPWMAALGYLTPDYGVYFRCGGTIVSDFYIVTAAHCLAVRPVVARLGKYYKDAIRKHRQIVFHWYGNYSPTSLMNNNRDGADNNRHIETVIKHPRYTSKSEKNDIALIKVNERIAFSSNIRPICLNIDLNDIGPDRPVYITGWGIVSTETRDRSLNLRKVDLRTVSLQECNRTVLVYNEVPNYEAFRSGVDQSQYCAHDPDGLKDSCDGDSGGPLQVISNNPYSAKIVGIVSFGVGCATKWPGVYTRVAYYIDWIESIVWPNGINS